jgi:hypothetical protein
MLFKKFFFALLITSFLVTQTLSVATAQTSCDQAQFVADLTIPDGTTLSPGATFTKTWRLMNAGSCTWTTSYRLVLVGGDSLGAPAYVRLPVSVAPGQMVDLSVNLIAPKAIGHYRGLWKLSNSAGVKFGIGSSGNDPFWVDINVADSSAVIFDFVTNAPYALWKSGAGPLPFPGTAGDYRGYALRLDNPHLEGDTVDIEPGLLTVPQNRYYGYIQAIYPEFSVQAGDYFQSLVNCEFGATGCYVTFRLEYMTSSGSIRSLWSWTERYEGRFYRANVNLTPLAGQKVRFILTLLSNGSASGDRAIWGAPRIVRLGSGTPPAPPPTLTPLPPLTPTATPFDTPLPTIAPAGCDKATFISDVTIPDGTLLAPGAGFTKTWRLRNSGRCTWTTAYHLVFYSGEQMSAPTSVNLPWSVFPGQTVDLSVNMIAPPSAGEYRGFWILQNASGSLFGIGNNADMPFWVTVKVAGEAPAGGYDFLANVCAAQWKSGAGVLPCPGSEGDSNGFVLRLDSAKLEDGSLSPALLTFPQNRYNGYIQGIYPFFLVQPGDRFQATVGCEDRTPCYVTFRLDYMTINGLINNFWTWREYNEGRPHSIDVSLTPLVGQNVRFILTLLATGSANNDRALWASPRIFRTNPATPPATYTPTLTPTPITASWPTYTNTRYNFFFRYPPGAQISNEMENYLYMALPFVPGTNLQEKYLEVYVAENVEVCQSPLATLSMPRGSENVTLNGIPFLKQFGEEGTTGHMYKWTAYSTQQDNICVSLDFVLKSVNPGVFETPPPLYDEALESAVFVQIASTFGWIPPTPTPTETFTETPVATPSETILPPGETPSTTPPPLSLLGPYAVRMLTNEQALNIYAAPGSDQPIVGTFPANATNVMRTGPTTLLSGNPWAEVLRADGGTGWVEARYLSEYLSSAEFCADARPQQILAQLRQAMNTSNGDLFASLVSPAYGVDVRLWAYASPVNFDQTAARNVFTSTQVYNWGSGPRGEPDMGTFKDIIQPKMLEVLNDPNLETYCDSLTKVFPLGRPWPYENVHFYHLYKPGTPGLFDFRTWLIGFEYINHQPYLFAMVTIVWEP